MVSAGRREAQNGHAKPTGMIKLQVECCLHQLSPHWDDEQLEAVVSMFKAHGLFGNGGYNYRTTDSNGNSWNTTCQPSGLFGNANMVCR